jgi:hypothetical protein
MFSLIDFFVSFETVSGTAKAKIIAKAATMPAMK